MARLESYTIHGGSDEDPFLLALKGSRSDGTQRPVKFSLDGAIVVEVYMTSLAKDGQSYKFEGMMDMPPGAEDKTKAVSGVFNPETHRGILRVPM